MIVKRGLTGSWGYDPAERMAQCCHRPSEPDPDNAGEGTSGSLLLSGFMLPSPIQETKKRKMSKTDASLQETSTIRDSKLIPKAKTRVLAEIAGAVALSGALNLVSIFTLPQGGSVTLASMSPVILLGLRRGSRIGVLAGVLLGLIVLIEQPFVVHPIQFLLDYPIAFGALGLAGFFQADHWQNLIQLKPLFRKVLPVLGVIAGISGRFVSHFVSGIVFFSSYAPAGEDPAVYSAIYNASYLLPELVITSVVISLLVRFKALELYR